MSDIQQKIDGIVKGHRVVLFMKGTASFRCAASPVARCRCSRLQARRTDHGERARDDAIRQGIKNTPTGRPIPQLYIDGEFIGGSDIMMEMYESGELATEARRLEPTRPRATVAAPGMPFQPAR